MKRAVLLQCWLFVPLAPVLAWDGRNGLGPGLFAQRLIPQGITRRRSMTRVLFGSAGVTVEVLRNYLFQTQGLQLNAVLTETEEEAEGSIAFLQLHLPETCAAWAKGADDH